MTSSRFSSAARAVILAACICPFLGYGAPPPVRETYGMPQWLVDAVRADDFVEPPATTSVVSLPYNLSATGESPHLAMPHAAQPYGALSGKVVFVMAGHGWTYDDNRQSWYTQRGVSYGIVEDFGNLDQMHMFAHYAWNCGATIVPLRPIDHQPEERILDNTSAQVTFFGPWLQSASRIYFGDERDSSGYAFTTGTLSETAIARYRPWIPVSGDYPVYGWVRDGKDRATQLYRIAHSGGVSDIRLNHRRVGKGWVWLGTYHFNKGDVGYVDISNQLLDPYDSIEPHVVVADALRFGNGRGDVNRDAGISGHLREDEGDCYWIARSLGPQAQRRLYTSGRDDGAATVGSPPKAAAYMNRETEGQYLDRVLISFHSNASSGQSRGAVGLYNRNPEQRPTFQEQLAEALGAQINDDMRAVDTLPNVKWGDRKVNRYNGINFGELRKDYIQNEMCATIVEVAFHDQPDDAKLLLDPESRIALARSSLRGLLRWFGQVQTPVHAVTMLPSAPQEVRVSVADAGTSIMVNWKPGAVGPTTGDPATDYRVYFSRNGRGFDAGLPTRGATSVEAGALGPGETVFVRITAINGAGESWPSEVMCVRAAPKPSGADPRVTSGPTQRKDVLLVYGVPRLTAQMNQPQWEDSCLGSSRGPGGMTFRVRLPQAVMRETVIRAADALTTLGRYFDSCTEQAVVDHLVPLQKYGVVVWLAGNDSGNGPLANPAAQETIRAYLAGGGRLFLSGAAVARDLDRQTTSRDEPRRSFLGQVLGSSYLTTGTVSRVLLTGSDLPLRTSDADLADQGFELESEITCDTVTPVSTRNAQGVLRYGGRLQKGVEANAPAAAITAYDGKVVYFAFPIEAICSSRHREALIGSVLQYLSR